MTPQAIFWAREAHREVAIREAARKFYDQYDGMPRWDSLTASAQFPWCLAAERHLTAQSIERERQRAWKVAGVNP